MIEIQEVSKHYKLGQKLIKAVDKVNVRINPKDFILITGRSGSGKTTLLSLIAGLMKPTHGKISIDGDDIWSMSEIERSNIRNQKIGFIFQFPSLISTLNVVDNVALPTMFNKREWKPIDLNGEIMELLKLVGLSENIRSYPSQLSGGEQKRTAIARSLINNPQIILADEPTGDLDLETEKEVMNLIKEMNKRGKTVILVSHSPELAEYSSRHFTMDRGALKEQ
ncbi:MAG: ABC transporter ATP-binding protein [Candidatus Hodarchaeota archaeon]